MARMGEFSGEICQILLNLNVIVTITLGILRKGKFSGGNVLGGEGFLFGGEVSARGIFTRDIFSEFYVTIRFQSRTFIEQPARSANQLTQFLENIFFLLFMLLTINV